MICIWSKIMTPGLVCNSWNLMSHDIFVLEFVTWWETIEFVTLIHSVTQFPIVSAQRPFLPFRIVAWTLGGQDSRFSPHKIGDRPLHLFLNEALLIEGNGSMSRICVMTCENTSLTPMRNFIVDSFAWRLFNLWLMLHTHLLQVH